MKRILIVLAFAAVFVVKSDPIKVLSFDSSIESVEFLGVDAPEFLIEADQTRVDFTYPVTELPRATDQEAVVIDVGKQISTGVGLTNKESIQLKTFLFIKSGKIKLGKVALWHRSRLRDPDSPYTRGYI